MGRFTYSLALLFALCGVSNGGAAWQSPTPQESSDPYFNGQANSPAQNPGTTVATQAAFSSPNVARGAGFDLQPPISRDGPGNSQTPRIGSASGLDRKTNRTLLTENSPALVADGANAPATDSAEWFEPGRVLVIVGGRPIMVGDMTLEINELIEEMAPNAPANVKQMQREALVPRMLPKYIDRMLLYADVVRGLPSGADMNQINKSLGKSFDEEALPEFLKKRSLNSPLDFDLYLRTMGSSLRQYRQDWMNDQFVRYFVSQKLNIEREISHAEMWEYYQSHHSEFEFPARAKWEQLNVRFDRVPDRREARNLIAEMGNEVVYGAPLDAVAKRSSQGSQAEEGGQQGWVNQGSLAFSEIDRALFTLPLNELSDIIETKIGLHIIRVQERVEAGAIPFREAQVKIKEKLKNDARNQQYEEYIAKLRSQIPIEIVDDKINLPDRYLVK